MGDHRNSCGVLVVEPDPAVARLDRLALERFGFRAAAVAGGRAALEIYRQRGPEIGVVLLDQNLPDLTLADVVRQLLAHDPPARVVLTSGYPVVGLATDVLRLFRGLLRKPYTIEQLVAAVRSALNGERN
jgi:CheY-like chemotaxis protein